MSTIFSQQTYRIVVGTVLTLGLVAVVSGQMSTTPAPPRSSMEELLAEVRSLRAEIRRASDTSIRAQLLVARLQVQEQRINTLSRQLSEAERQLSENERGKSALAAQLSMFEKEGHEPSPEEREGFDLVFKPLKAQLELMEKTDRDLRLQQTNLTGLIADEQSRWTTFNALLDDLAKTVEVKPVR